MFDGDGRRRRSGGRGALRPYRRRVQLIFQDPYETLDPKHTIGVVRGGAAAGRARQVPRAERKRRVHEALEAAGLRPASDFAARYPHELSGGQRQRVVIAGALVMDPELVVADEPVSMLDVSIRTELLRLMLDLRRDRGPHLPVHHPRPRDRLGARRPDRRDVPRQDHGDRAGGGRSSGRPATRTPRRWSRCPRPRIRPSPARRARTILVGETPDAAHVPPGCRFHPRCPLAFDRCRVEEPPLIEVGEGHQAACWLATAGPRDLPVIDAVTAVRRRPPPPADVGRAQAAILGGWAPPPARSPRRRRSASRPPSRGSPPTIGATM